MPSALFTPTTAKAYLVMLALMASSLTIYNIVWNGMPIPACEHITTRVHTTEMPLDKIRVCLCAVKECLRSAWLIWGLRVY